MRACSLVFLSTLACTGSIEVTPSALEQVPAITLVAIAPGQPSRPERTALGSWNQPSSLWIQDEAVTVLDGSELRQRSSTGFISLLMGTASQPTPPGAVKSVARRGPGVFLAAAGGLFHDAPGQLLRAPISDDFSGEPIRFLQLVDECLWVTTENQAVRVFERQRETVELDDVAEPGAVEAIVGRTPTKAVLVKGGSVYAVDLAQKTAKTLARGLGRITAIDRKSDTVLLGTTEGLVEVAADDGVTRRTFAAPGATAQAVVDLEVTTDWVLVTTGTQVLRVSHSGSEVLADVAEPKPNASGIEANGDAWLLDGNSLVRLALSSQIPPSGPSFAAEVKPFLVAHCQSCHATGADYSPQIDLADYAVAKAQAARVMARLADSASPMPPASTEVLTAAQYDVVTRWFQGGMLP